MVDPGTFSPYYGDKKCLSFFKILCLGEMIYKKLSLQLFKIRKLFHLIENAKIPRCLITQRLNQIPPSGYN